MTALRICFAPGIEIPDFRFLGVGGIWGFSDCSRTGLVAGKAESLRVFVEDTPDDVSEVGEPMGGSVFERSLVLSLSLLDPDIDWEGFKGPWFGGSGRVRLRPTNVTWMSVVWFDFFYQRQVTFHKNGQTPPSGTPARRGSGGIRGVLDDIQTLLR